LNEEGYYANKDRSDNPLDELIFDYQRNLAEWTLVSTGNFRTQDLQMWNVTVGDFVVSRNQLYCNWMNNCYTVFLLLYFS
jgi:hypothetical protein